MYTVKFKRSNGEEIILANCSIENIMPTIETFLKEHNYKSYYTITTFYEDHVCFDVGSWSEFFNVYGDMDVLREFLSH